MDYKNLLIGITSFVIGILYLVNLKKRLNKEYVNNMNSFDKSMKFKGFLAGFGFVIIGIIMIYREIKMLF
ncbi:Immunity protein 17 [Flavobacterium cucumis]|uniref:Uncharacterized protein n=1 Tax=Flavobacterium cucumis TaxID=416016 RepID=A0A1M7ZWK6_9FLAO|nr:hypothetical protein SAMN05443547_1631 [Flavobacterium cucumis]